MTTEGTMGKKYAVGNNTDYGGRSFETNNYRAARREWNRIKPRADAGNLYDAWFTALCNECGSYHNADPESEYVRLGASQCGS